MSRIKTPPRVLRRRAERRERILQLAAESFAQQGPDAVRLDELAELADVARGTLYSHFPTKDALLVAIVRPALEALETALTAVEENDARGIVGAVLRRWVGLWRDHRHALRIAHTLQLTLPSELEPLHRRVVAAVHRQFTRAAAIGRLRGTPQWAGMVIARLGVPLLETYDEIDPTGDAFVDAVSGLLLAPHRSRARGQLT